MDRRNQQERRPVKMSALLTFLISGLVTVIILVMTVLFIFTYANSLYQNTTMNSEQAVSRVASTVSIYTADMRNDLDTVIKELDRDKDKASLEEALKLMVKLRSNIVSIIIYDEEGNILSCCADGLERKPGYTPEDNLSFSGELFDREKEFAVTSPHVQNLFVDYYPWVVTVACGHSSEIFGKSVFVSMDIRFSSMASYVDNVGIGSHGYCFVMDSGGELVYHPQQQLIYAGLKKEDMNRIRDRQDGVFRENDYIYAIRTLDNGLWRVVGVSYTDEIIRYNLQPALYLVIFLLAACIAIGFIASWALSRQVSKPVRKLMLAMESFEKDAVNFEYGPIRGIEEVQMLSHSFGHMVDMIQKLMEQIKNEEITLRKTELRALQAQINPHFLYNTLDSIQWMCEGGRTEDAVRMISALARLFRISISKGKELIPIEKELDHAKSYLIIQSFRYKNQFSYEFRVDKKVLPYLCNKITLQPLIENAIYHGIDRMVDEGRIVITAGMGVQEQDIVLTVSDNGVGMTKEECESILNKEGNENNGIGIKNVNDRIKIFFGDSYGLTVESEPDEGTRITIRFPKLGEGEEYEAK